MKLMSDHIIKVTKALLSGIAWGVAGIPFEVAGIFLVPVAYRYRTAPLDQTPWWIKPWVNPEDWTSGYLGHEPEDNCVPKDLRERYSGFWGFYRYHALRNRAHGLRNYSWYTLRLSEDTDGGFITPHYLPHYAAWYIHPDLSVPGVSFWYVAWQGGHVGVKYLRFFEWGDGLYVLESKFGWRITPRDIRDGASKHSVRWRYGTTATLQPLNINRVY